MKESVSNDPAILGAGLSFPLGLFGFVLIDVLSFRFPFINS